MAGETAFCVVAAAYDPCALCGTVLELHTIRLPSHVAHSSITSAVANAGQLGETDAKVLSRYFLWSSVVSDKYLDRRAVVYHEIKSI